MNREIYQTAYIVSSCKMAMKMDKRIKFTPSIYEKKMSFKFLPPPEEVETDSHSVSNVSEWFEEIKKSGLQDIKMVYPYPLQEIDDIRDAYTPESMIMCYFPGGRATCFSGDWKFDSVQREWDVTYSEHEVNNLPAISPRFENFVSSFRRILIEIKHFASRLGFENYANIFGSSLNFLDGESEYPDKKNYVDFPQIPNYNLRIFKAVSLADVFGARGSWNDGPYKQAKTKGLEKEYDELSEALLRNIRFGILYAVNEW